MGGPDRKTGYETNIGSKEDLNHRYKSNQKKLKDYNARLG
jgi:hypothetical protein